MTDNKLWRQLLQGQEVNLHEVDPSLHRVRVCIGWEAPEESQGFPVDLDGSCFLIGRGDRVRHDTDFVFYNNLEADGGLVKHYGDTLEGGEGDREMIDIDLEGLHFDIDKVVFTVTIHNAEERQQHFGLVRNAYIRILNLDTKEELTRFGLTDGAASDNAYVFGEMCREGMGWKFVALGQGGNGGLYKIAHDFGVNVAPM